jgi:hypothetical protein
LSNTGAGLNVSDKKDEQYWTLYPASHKLLFSTHFSHQYFPMLVLFKTGTSQFFKSPPCMSGTTVDCIPTAVPNGKNEGG